MIESPASSQVSCSAIRHLAYVIWPSHDPKASYFVLYTAFFDASGRRDATGIKPALFVSGFVASVDKWEKFQEQWPALLDAYDITPPFSTAQFEAGQGQYASWNHDKTKRDEFRLKAIRLINRHTNKAFSVGVVIPDLRRMFEEYEVPDYPSHPYPFCGVRVYELLIRWAQNRHKKIRKFSASDRYQIVFEHGDQDQGELERALVRMYDVLPIFLRKKDGYAGFEACDFVAWWHRRWLVDRTEHGKLPRPFMHELTRQLAKDSVRYADWDTMQKACIRDGYPRRVNQ